ASRVRPPYPVSSLPARATSRNRRACRLGRSLLWLIPPRHDSQPSLHIIRARASGRSVWVASPCGRSLGAGAGRVTVRVPPAGRRSFGWLALGDDGGPRRRGGLRRAPLLPRFLLRSPPARPPRLQGIPPSRHRQIRAGFREISGLPGFAPTPQCPPVATREWRRGRGAWYPPPLVAPSLPIS
ncbi:LAG1 longevity assurance homolog 2, partial [Zea mays]